MEIPKRLIREFVKVTNNSEKPKTESTVYGTVVKNGDTSYVQLDGSDILTPISTTTDIENGDRVTVLIKNHTAIISGNLTSPAARTDDVQVISGDVSVLTADNVTINNRLIAAEAEVNTLSADNVTINNRLIAAEADINTLSTNKLDAGTAEITYATIESLDATNVKVANLEAAQGDFETLTAENFEAVDAKINNLVVGDLDAVYANIDFSNIGQAAMEYFYAESGLIKDVTVSDGTITGELIGVTIKGDLIEGNTIVADKLVVKGEDGLYYKLNVTENGDTTVTDSYTTEELQNGLLGTVIIAKSITAEKISVDDLVAFDATIGGFNITTDALYSGVKSSVDNTTRGIYLDNDGQLAIGDSISFLRYYKTSEGNYKLELSVGGKDAETAIDDAAKTATNFLSYDTSDGLQLGDRSGGVWSGFRSQLTSAAFNILDSAGTVLASYGTKLIELGKNATDAVIRLCGGQGQIEYAADPETSDNYLQISSDKLRLASESMSSLYSAVTVDDQMTKSAVNVSPDEVYIYSGSSNITLGSDIIALAADGDVTVSANSLRDSYGEFSSVIEGSSGNWTYRKWSNGTVDLWGSYAVSGVACSTALGAMYRTDTITLTNFPFDVYSPYLTASYESNGYGGILWATSTTTNNSPPSYYLLRTTSGTIASGKIIVHVIGKWKE